MRLWVIQLCRGVMRAKEYSEQAQFKLKFVCLLRYQTIEKIMPCFSNHWENVHCYAVSLSVQRSLRTSKAVGQPKTNERSHIWNLGSKNVLLFHLPFERICVLIGNILLCDSRMAGGVLSLEGCRISTDCTQQINSTITENKWQFGSIIRNEE